MKGQDDRTLPTDSAKDDDMIAHARQQAETIGAAYGGAFPYAAAPWTMQYGPGASLPPPDYFPGYEVVRVLAAGGEGVVYEAVQTRTGGTVAIKALVAGLRASPRAKKRFEREIELIVQLKHPHIVTLFEAGSAADGLPFYVMDYIQGVALDQYVRQQDLPLKRTIELIASICRAVQHFHHKGVIHRDLKPSNILVDADGIPKIVDFGLAKLLTGPVDMTMSVTQEIKGTIPYMSPEQAGGHTDEVDTRSDVYALGVILYKVLTGSFPYTVTGALTEVLQRICYTPPTSPRKAWQSSVDLSDELREARKAGRCPFGKDVEVIILSALEKDPEARYQSAQALADDLERYLKNEPIVPHVSRFYRARKFAQRHRPSIAAAVVVVALTAFGIHSRLQAKQASIEAKQAQLDANERELRAWDVSWNAVGSVLFSNDRLRQTQQWISALDEIIAANPESGLTYTLRSILLYEERRYAEAREDARKALALNPKNAMAQYVEGDWRLRTFDFPGAVDAYEHSLSSLTTLLDVPRLWHNLAKARRIMGDYDLALHDAERAVALAPDKVLALAGLGVSRRMVSDVDGAIADLRKVADLDTTWSVQCHLWIWEMLRLRDAPGDRENAEQALAAAVASVTAGGVDRICVDICRGEMTTESALETVKGSAGAFYVQYYLGARGLVRGDTAEALAHFQSCLQIANQYDELRTDLPLEFDFAKWHIRRLERG